MRELLPLDRVADCALHVPFPDGLGLLQDLGLADEPEDHQLAHPVRGEPGRALGPRHVPVGSAPPALHRPAGVRHHEGGSALEHGKVLHLRLDGRDYLDGRGPGADHGDPAARRRPAGIPARGVHDRAGEAADAGDVRQRRLDPGDQVLRGEHPVRRGDLPAVRGLVPAHVSDFTPETDMREYWMPRRDAVQPG